MEDRIEKYIESLTAVRDVFTKRSNKLYESNKPEIATSYSNKASLLKIVISDLREILKEEREATK